MMRRWMIIGGAVLLFGIGAYVFFRVPYLGKTPYERLVRYYGTVFIYQWKENDDFKLAFNADGRLVKTAKEQLKVPVEALRLPVFSLWIEPKDKQVLDTIYREKRAYHLPYEDRSLLWPKTFDAPYVPGVLEAEGKEFQVDIKLRGNGLWHFIGNKSYRIRFENEEDRVYGLGPSINLRRVEQVGMIPYLLHLRLGEMLGLPAPKTNVAHLFVNGKYQGLRTMFEQVDAGFLERRGLDADIFREAAPTPQETLLSYFGDDVDAYPHWDSSTASEEPSAWRNFLSFLKFVALADDTTFRRDAPKHVDIDTLLRFGNLSALGGAGYLLSHDHTLAVSRADGRVTPVVSDSEGFMDLPANETRDPHEIYNPLLYRLFSLNPSLLLQKDRDLSRLLAEEGSVRQVSSLIDSIVADIEHDVSFATTDFRDDVEQIKQWYVRRHAFLTDFLAAQPKNLSRVRIEEWRPPEFDLLPEETPFYLNGMKLYRKQLRFVEN